MEDNVNYKECICQDCFYKSDEFYKDETRRRFICNKPSNKPIPIVITIPSCKHYKPDSVWNSG